MGFLKSIFGKTEKKTLSSSGQNAPIKSKGIVAINNKKGGFDAFGALYRHTLQEISIYMGTKANHPVQEIIRKNFQAPITYVTAYYHTGLNFITYIFSFPASSKMLNNPTLAISVGDLFKNQNIDIVTVTATYELKHIKLQNSQLVVEGHPDISLMLEDSSEYVPIDDYQKKYELVISPDRFYIDSSNIKKTSVHKVESGDFVEEVIEKKTSPIIDLSSMSGLEFEQYCKKLLLANGFTKVDVTKASHDYGGDILAEKDKIKYVIQCKRYASPIGIDAVQQAIGSKSIYNCHVAAVMTNNVFTDSAKTLATKNNVILWDATTIKRYQKNLIGGNQGNDSMNFVATRASNSVNQNANTDNTVLPNGDMISNERQGKLINVIIKASDQRKANICISMITTAAERYENSGICARVTYNGETRSITNIDHLNGNELNTCTWTSTVSTPLSAEEKKYANAVYNYTKRLLGARQHMSADDIANNLYCKYNYTFASGGLIGQELHRQPELFMQMFIKPQTLSDSILAFAFYNNIFLEKVKELNLGYSFAITGSDSTMFMYKEPGKEEETVCMDKYSHPTTQVPRWTKMVGSYKFSTIDDIKLKSLGSCFIEFINNINLLSQIED